MDKLLKEFENCVFPTKKAGRSFMDNYLKKVAIERKSYQGAHSLEVSDFHSLFIQIGPSEKCVLP